MILRKGVASLHPLAIFWIGVLAGALAIVLVFSYKSLISVDYQSSTLKYQYSVPKSKSVPKYQQKAGTSKSTKSSKSSKGYTSIGTPDGN